jgi:HK97 family phage major capsid protein
VLAKAQPRRLSLRGKYHMPRKKAGSQSYWGDPRGRSKKSSRPTLGVLTLDEKALTSVVAYPKRLAQLSSINTAMFIRDEILEEMSVKLDVAFFQGAGNQFEPLGYLNLPASGDSAPNWVDVGAALAFTLPITLRQKAYEANSTFIRPYWFMAPVMETLLMTVTPNSSTNPFWFNSMNDKKQILGIPYESTNHVPVDTDASYDPSTLTLMDMAQYLLGQEGEGFEFAETDVGGYYDEDGNVALTFPNGEVATMVIYRCDMAPRNPLAITIGKNIRTAAS